ncbi:Aldo/keto reductase [Mycena olivaceomarginata]|nr:Aldo/keto reductase [Mycena olivaceomarginata]
MSPIPHRKLGHACCGDWIRYHGYGAVESDEERLKVLDAAYAAGSTFWDTANVYGDSEDLIGKCEIFLATKFGITTTGARGDPDYVKEQCAQSLARLGVEYIDLYYQHPVDSNTPIEKTVGAMADLVKAGKVKYLGLSDCAADGLRRAHAVHPIAALQIEYSPSCSKSRSLRSTSSRPRAPSAQRSSRTHRAPLGRGFLTGQIKSVYDLEADDFRRTAPKFAADSFPRILALAGKIGEVGKAHGATAGQTTLAWTLAQGEDPFATPGTKRRRAASIELTAEELAVVRLVAEATEIPGNRYGPGYNELTYVDSSAL